MHRLAPFQAGRLVASALALAALPFSGGCTRSEPAAAPQPDVPAARDPGPHDLPPPETLVLPSPLLPPNAAIEPAVTATARAELPARPSPIAAENARTGDSGWRLSRFNPALAAFTHRTSYAPGEAVQVHAAYSSPTQVRWELYRLGYYGGVLARRVLSGGPSDLPAAAPPQLDATTGEVRAPWPSAFSFTIPDDAVTGVYLLKLSGTVGDTHTFFVVRERSAGATTVVAIAVNTYQAYNEWGGNSLYGNRRTDWSEKKAFAVSFDRPYGYGNGTGLLEQKDRDFITFAEGQGYDVAYATDVDLDRDAGLLVGRRLVVVQGHSEYWTAPMRTALDAAVGRGTHLAFLGANNGYWQVRYEPTANGERRRIVGYKELASRDPMLAVDPKSITALFRDARVNRPENALIGSMFGDWNWTAAPIIVKDASHWLWTGAGVSDGTTIPGVYGDETDKRYQNGHAPEGVAVLADGLVENYTGMFGRAETTLYTAKSGATVFNAASLNFARALAGPGSWDPRMQQLAANLFSKLAGNGVLGPAALKPLNLAPGLKPFDCVAGASVSTLATGLQAPAAIAFGPDGAAVVVAGNKLVKVTASGAVSVLAGGDEEGSADGPAASARFRQPRGVAVSAGGKIFVADTANHRIRLVEAGQVRTLAGLWEGFVDGAGSSARFTQPMGLALTSSGTVLVADSWNQRIREVREDGTTRTVAGSGALGITEGAGTSAQLSFPLALSLFPDGRALLAEAASGVVRVLGADEARTVSVFAGAKMMEGFDDGPASSARVHEVWSVVAAPNGDGLLLDSASARIRRVRGDLVQTVAGGAQGGPVDGPGCQAGFGAPRAAAFAPDGSLWVVDAAHGTVRRVVLPN